VTAAGVGATLVFASLAAGSTHLRRIAQPHRSAHVQRSTPVRAPAPPLVEVRSPAPAPAPPPAPATPAQPPVVVSGGS
jgi:hypothetical protein